MWFQESHRYKLAVNCKACMTSEKGLKTWLMFSVLHESKWLLTAWVIVSSWEKEYCLPTLSFMQTTWRCCQNWRPNYFALDLFPWQHVIPKTSYNLLFLCAETCRLWKFLLEIDRMLIWTWGVLRKNVLIEIIWNIKMIRTWQDFP